MSEIPPIVPTRALGRTTMPVEPVLGLPEAVLQRYNARVLDPTKVTRLAGQSLRPTVYIADSVLAIQPLETFALVNGDALDSAEQATGLVLVADDGVAGTPGLRGRAPLRWPAAFAAAQLARPPRRVIRVRLAPADDSSAKVDAWEFIQEYRQAQDEQMRQDPDRQLQLDHLVLSARRTFGSPFVPRVPMSWAGQDDSGSPTSSYGTPGWGGRQAVRYAGEPPARSADEQFPRRPVVAILDTGVGQHDWLPPEIVTLDPVVLDVPLINPEIKGVTIDPFEGVLDSDAGHGTFIAGLVRQGCPDANILAVQLMGGDGAVAESNLIDVLTMLGARHEAATAPDGPIADAIDVLSLSLGYYHESPEDADFDAGLLGALRDLTNRGVAVVCAAGNDATDRQMFPAAFSFDTVEDRLRILGVGATNPNGTTALFSNQGPWVTHYRPGAAVLSTYPSTIDGSDQAGAAVTVDGRPRATLDPDDFTGGFAIWSGTSFAAPVLAGELATALCADPAGLAAVDSSAMIVRANAAVAGATVDVP